MENEFAATLRRHALRGLRATNYATTNFTLYAKP